MQRLTLVISIIVLSVSLCVAQMPPKSAAIYTEGFENPDPATNLPAEWTHFNQVQTISITTEHVHSGKYSLKLVDEDPVQAVGLRSPHIKIEPGKSCWVTCWYYAEKGNNQSIYIEFWTAEGKRPESRGASYGSIASAASKRPRKPPL